MKDEKEEKYSKKSASSAFFSAGKSKSSLEKLEPTTIRSYIMTCLRKSEYEKLKIDLKFYGLEDKEEMTSFFSKEGSRLLNWSLVTCADDGPLKFFRDIVSRDILQKILRYDDFSIFRKFLSVQVGLEQSNWYNAQAKEVFNKKFRVLLDIDSEGIKKFMEKAENIADKDIQADAVKANFQNALQQFEDQNFTAQQFS